MQKWQPKKLNFWSVTGIPVTKIMNVSRILVFLLEA
nr:MAG TPA: hypothetical protein [Caudoviricetes sp.]